MVVGAPFAAAQSNAGPSLHPKARMETSLGVIVLELDAEKAPITVINFVDYVESKFYDGTMFHRVVPRTVIQGGAYLPDMTEKKEGLRPAILCEAYNGLTNERGAIAMYRVPGHSKSAQAQFFINLHANENFGRLRDGEGYAVFGKVVEGMEVVDAIRDVKVGPHPNYAAGKNPVVPVTPVVIRSIRMVTPLDRPAAESLATQAVLTDDVRLNAVIRRYETEADAKSQLTTSGLRTLDRVVGKGAFPLLEEAVELNYRGFLVTGKEFDNSEIQAHGPVTLNLFETLPGIREGVLGMQEGGKRVLIVPPKLAFGEEGQPGKVPPNSTLIYEIELLSVKPPVPKRSIKQGESKP